MAQGPTGSSGIITRTYKSGSIIYFEGDKSEYIYVLKGGRVVLTSVKLDTGEEVKEEVRQGEFFGVKSALGRYPREETAQTVGETIVLVLGLADFERLVLKNVSVVQKMLRVFSNQLRRINKLQRTVLGESDMINPDAELFRIGEYYFRAGIFEQAQYAYKKLMEHYPDSKFAAESMSRIKAISSGNVPPANRDLEAINDIQSDDDQFDTFSMDDSSSDSFFESTGSSENSSISDEMDNFLSDNQLGDLDDFTFDGMGGGDDENYLPHLFDNARDLFNQGQFNDALEVYEKIISTDDIKTSEEKKIYEDAHFETGRCYMKLGKPREALSSFNTIIKNYPKSKNIKNSLFYIGQIFQSAKQNKKAVMYYKKCAALAPRDDISQQAESRIKQLGA